VGVATAMTSGSWSERLGDRNPLQCRGTALPPNLLIAAKLIVFGLILKGYVFEIPELFLPMFPVFDLIPRSELLRPVLQVAFLLSATSLLLNWRVRTSSAIAGSVFLLGPLMSQGFYTNATFFAGAILLLIGLQHSPRMVWLIRAQFVLMYFGSGLNKIFEADWRSGQYMSHWLGTMIESDLYLLLANVVSEPLLARSLTWGTITIEFALAVGLTIPRLYRPAIWTAILFHSSSVFFSGTDFGIFLTALLAAMLAFAEWPERGSVRVLVDPTRLRHRLLRRISPRVHLDERFTFVSSSSMGDPARLGLHMGDRRYEGVEAFNMWLLLTPATYLVLALLIGVPQWGTTFQAVWIRDATLLFGFIWFCPVTWRAMGALRNLSLIARRIPVASRTARG